jgi:PH (Pleckstrin Homology) domain-containing protein
MPDDEGGGAPTPAAAVLTWRVSGGLVALKVAGVVVFAVVAAASLGDRVRLVMALVAAVALGAYAVRDLVAPVRLRADAEGLTVASGYAGHRRLGWAEVAAVRLDQRYRLGARSMLLEIDAGEALYLLSRYDLGAPCDEVAAALRAVAPRPGIVVAPSGSGALGTPGPGEAT